jgi:hypothetical protein
MNRRGRVPLVLAVTLTLLAGCSPDEAETTTTSASVTTSTEPSPATTEPGPSTTSTVAVSTTSAAPQGDTVTVLLYPFGPMGPEWTELVFPYGTLEEELGTAPGGEGLTLGPEYGTQLGDGTWWFLDAAKKRLAHFDSAATFMDAVAVPPEILVDGQYFQFQNPIGLNDGTVIASGFRGEASTALLILSDQTTISETIIDASVPWVTTDGSLLYGFSFADDAPTSLDPATFEVAPTEWFLARDGSRYMVTVTDTEVIVELPDAGVTKTLQLRFSEDPEVAAGAGIEVETGADGSLFILFYGAPISDEIFGIGSLVRIRPDGFVEEAMPIVDPFSPADPGSPSHLGVTPGTSSPWLMVVAEDGVHVYLGEGLGASGQ